MDWPRYKCLCERPDVVSRWLVEESARHATPSLRTALLAMLHAAPLPKPADHKGGPAADMFTVPETLPAADVEAALEASARAGARTCSGGRLDALVLAWQELREFRSKNA